MTSKNLIEMTAAAVCQRDVSTITGDSSLVEAAAMMRDHHVGSLIVIENNKPQSVPIGIITDRDIVVQIMALDIPYEDVLISELMSDELYKVNGDQSVFELFKYMQEYAVRRLPVVDDMGDLIGIISLDDLVVLVASELENLAQVIRHQQNIEKTKRVPIQ